MLIEMASAPKFVRGLGWHSFRLREDGAKFDIHFAATCDSASSENVLGDAWESRSMLGTLVSLVGHDGLLLPGVGEPD